MSTKLSMRAGTKQGSKHVQLGYNNQDGYLADTFAVPAWRKRYHVGIVSDGCSGKPAFSRTEVGARLLPPYVYGRIQGLVCSGTKLEDIARVCLYPMVTEFIRTMENLVMPGNVSWPYPVPIDGREGWGAGQRFRADFMSATLLGFITDEIDLVVFSAGDGIKLVNNDLTVIDQNDQPDYPAASVNRLGGGFNVQCYKMDDVSRAAVMTDGPKELVADTVFRDALFTNQQDSPLGLQFLLNVTYNQRSELMRDDCTVVTLQKLEVSG